MIQNEFVFHSFIWMSFLAGIASAITSGIVGCYVVVKRIVFISGSIAHSVLGGMGLFLWIKRIYNISWLNPLYGALGSAILSAFLLGWIHLKYQEREDTIIGAIWSLGMAIGVIFVSLTPGYNVELLNFLFGNILWITENDLILLFSLALLISLLSIIFYTKFRAVCFDENQAKLQKISPEKYYLLLLNLIAISIVILIQVVGSILVIAMLTIPAAIATGFYRSLGQIMKCAIILGSIFSTLGLIVSYYFNWPPGATIALTAAFFYLLFLVYKSPILLKKS